MYEFNNIMYYLIGSVEEDDSIFITLRDVPKTTKDPTYVPLLVTPSVDPTTSALITETCGDNIECAYDIAVTGNVEVGRETLEDIEEHMMIVNLTLPSTYVCMFTCTNLNIIHPNLVLGYTNLVVITQAQMHCLIYTHNVQGA